MAVTAAQVKAFAPELAAVADSIVDTWIGWAPAHIKLSAYGDQADQAVMLFVCHKVTLTQAGNAAAVGPVEEERVGPVAVKYAGGLHVAKGSDLAYTSYGRTLKTLRRRYGGTPLVV